jgi:hypothetical protein
MVQVRASFAPVMPGLFLLGLGLGIWDMSQNLEGAVDRRPGASSGGGARWKAPAACGTGIKYPLRI